MNRIVRLALLTAVLALCPAVALGQTPPEDRIAQATILSIPSSPAFVLLGVDPAKVARPGFPQDFKLDLLVNDEGLAPDIAIEARPVWVLFFQDVGHDEYAAVNPVVRTLSTLSVSLATAERDDVRQLAWSAKLSLLRKDPLLDSGYTRAIADALDVSDPQFQLAQERIERLLRAQSAEDSVMVEGWFSAQWNAIEESLTERVLAIADSMTAANWNAPGVDIAIGQVLDYHSSALDSLEFRESAMGAWVTGGIGFGEHVFVAGLAKWLAFGDDLDHFYGANIRIGTPRVRFFAEYIYERLEEDAKVQTLAYGGSLRLGEGRELEFGIRTEYDDDFSLERLRPIVKLNWNLTSISLTSLLASIER